MLPTWRPSIHRKLKQFSILENNWLILISFVIFLFVIFIASANILNTSSSFEIIPVGNKFRINFHISKNDQANFASTLQALNLPQAVKKGVEFELDSTTSAALAFAAPIKARVSIQNKQIKINGSIETSLPKVHTENFRLPQSTKLAVFAPNVEGFIKNRLSIPTEFDNWLTANLFSQSGQVLVLYGEKNDFFTITKADKIAFDELNTFKIKSDEQFYKKDLLDGNLEIHLLKLPKDTEEQVTLSIFQQGLWVYLVSSPETVQEVVRLEKEKDLQFEFPKPDSNFEILFKNSGYTADSFEFLSGQKEWIKTIENVEEFEFVLKGRDFSGLIKLK